MILFTLELIVNANCFGFYFKPSLGQGEYVMRLMNFNQF